MFDIDGELSDVGPVAATTTIVPSAVAAGADGAAAA